VAQCLLYSIQRPRKINLKLSLEMEIIMKTKTAITKSGVSNPSLSTTDTKIYTVILGVVGLFASAVGIWAFACLIGGMVAGGGPLGLIAGWFKAVNGL